MVESISMQVYGTVPKPIIQPIYQVITPACIADILRIHLKQTDPKVIEFVSTSYRTFPTEDLALRAYPNGPGTFFHGMASGGMHREERVAVKYVILDYISQRLADHGFRSEINIADLTRESIQFMVQHGLLRGNARDLKQVAEVEGNLDNIMIGLAGAMTTPLDAQEGFRPS